MVEANFSDARSAGYDRQQWQRLKEEALARPLRDRAAAYRWASVLELGLDGEQGVGEGAEPLLCMLWLVLVPHLCAMAICLRHLARPAPAPDLASLRRCKPAPPRLHCRTCLQCHSRAAGCTARPLHPIHLA